MELRVGAFGPFQYTYQKTVITPVYEAEVLIPVADHQRLQSGRYESYAEGTPYVSFLHDEIGRPDRDWFIKVDQHDDRGHPMSHGNERIYFACRKKALLFVLRFSP